MTGIIKTIFVDVINWDNLAGNRIINCSRCLKQGLISRDEKSVLVPRRGGCCRTDLVHLLTKAAKAYIK